jgi:hypothetical protein
LANHLQTSITVTKFTTNCNYSYASVCSIPSSKDYIYRQVRNHIVIIHIQTVTHMQIRIQVTTHYITYRHDKQIIHKWHPYIETMISLKRVKKLILPLISRREPWTELQRAARRKRERSGLCRSLPMPPCQWLEGERGWSRAQLRQNDGVNLMDLEEA